MSSAPLPEGRVVSSGAEALPEVPPYRAIRRIGSGPRGSVYEATDGRRRLAVKIFAPGASPEDCVLERFRRDSPQRIRHPNLSVIEGHGETPDGKPFVVMPFFPGDSLAVVLRDLERGRSERSSLSPLSVGPDGELHPEFARRAVELFAQAAEGLGRAHEAGVVHGRLGPGNLHLSPAGRLLVSDFAGRGTPVADVYALGAVLRELLSRARVLGARLPRELEACLAKATANRAEERYRNCSEFASDLERFLRGEKPQALSQGEPALATQARSKPARPRIPVPAAAALIFAALLGVAYIAGRQRSPENPLVSHNQPPTPEVRATRLHGSTPADPLESFLEAPSAPLRASALERLRSEILNGLRPEKHAYWAIRALHPPDSAVTQRAIETLAVLGSGQVILDALRIQEGEPEVTLDGNTFRTLCAALENAFDPPAIEFLCALSLPICEALDTLAVAASPSGREKSASLQVPPNLRVELTGRDARGFRTLWIRVRSKADPTELVAHWQRLAADPELARELAEGLERAGTPEAILVLKQLARDYFVVVGEDASAALARLGEYPALLEIVRSDLPREYRERILERVGEALAGLCSIELRDLALRNPDPSIRKRALDFLSQHGGRIAHATIPSAAGDPQLKSQALAWLHRLPAGEAAPIAVELSGHPDPLVRAHAVAILASMPRGTEAARLAQAVLSPLEEARVSAATVLLWRRELAWIPRTLSALLDPTRAPAARPQRAAWRGMNPENRILFSPWRGWMQAAWERLSGALNEAAEVVERATGKLREIGARS